MKKRELLDAKLNLEQLKGGAPVFQKFLSEAEAMVGSCHGCPLCERSFDRKQEFVALRDKLQNIIEQSESSDAIRGMEETLLQKEKLLAYLEKNKVAWNAETRGVEEGVKIDAKLVQINERQQTLESDLVEAKRNFDRMRAKEEQAKQIQQNFARISQWEKETKELEREMRVEEAALFGQSSDRNQEEVFDQQKQVQQKVDEASVEVAKWNKRREEAEKEKFIKLDEINSLGKEKVEIEREIEKRVANVTQRDHLCANVPQLEQRIQTLRAEVEENDQNLSLWQTQEKDLEGDHEAAERAADDDIESMKDKQRNLKQFGEAVDRCGSLFASLHMSESV
eukprot:SAG11_NODE_2069_length_3864_cov_2.863214_2_plen_338_part_00